MPQLIIQSGYVKCPGCGLYLVKEREQDGRVALMRHPVAELCSLSHRLLRVDRINGYSEELHEA